MVKAMQQKYNSFSKLIFLILVGLSFSFSTVKAQGDDKAQDLAKQSANPVASLITVPFQFNFNQGLGEFDRSQFVLNIQPVLPISVTEDINMINRVIIPIISQPDLTSESGSTFGIGNTNYTAFFTPAKPGSVIWGIGPSFNLPTISSTKLGGSEFGIGASFVTLTMPGKWVLGLLASNVWSYVNSNLNTFFGQYFIVYNFNGGWFLNSAPSISANWNAESGEQWTIPFGLGGGKVTRIGKQPVKFNLGGYYYAVAPTNGPEWLIQFQFFLLFPKS